MCKTVFPHPNLLQNYHFSGGISALCCSKNDIFCRLSGKWPSWEAQFHITIDFARILDQFFAISQLNFVTICKKTVPVPAVEHSTFGEAITAWHEACVGTFTHAYPYSAKINANFPPRSGSSSAAGSSVFWEGLWTMACSLYFYWTLDMSYAFQPNVVLFLSPILHRMLLFANLQQCAEAKIEGRRCCPPQRAFNKGLAVWQSEANFKDGVVNRR